MVAHTVERVRARRFYVWIGVFSAAVALLGFSLRYFVPLAQGTLQVSALVHVHGLFMFGWVALLILQTSLVATGRTALHRSVGMAGVALGALVVFTAMQIAILQLARDAADGVPPLAREFVIKPITEALLVAVLFAVAIAKVRRPETHKRLMLLATFVILTPAFARLYQIVFGAVPPDRMLNSTMGAIGTDVMIAVAMLYDLRTRGRPHPAYLYGGAFIVLTQLVRSAINTTTAWYAVTDWLIQLTR